MCRKACPRLSPFKHPLFKERGTHGSLANMRTVLLITIVSLLMGCSISKEKACRKWVDSREIYSSYERCLSCARKHGTEDLHAVRSCTFTGDINELRAQ
jgi:hypothetical protein